MMSRRRDYYPQYYRAKRRRERAVLVISTLFFVVVGIAAIVFLSIYINRVFRHPSTLEQVVAQKEELTARPPEVPSPSKKEGPMGVVMGKMQTEPIELGDITEYAESVPEVSIILQGLGTLTPASTEEPLQEMTEDAESASEGTTPDEVDHPSDGETEAEPLHDASGAPPKRETKAGEKQETTPSGEKKEPVEPKPPAKGVSEYTFTVFAGIYESDAEAAKQKAHLRELGFDSGTLTRSQGGKKSYLVYVGDPLPEYELAEAVKRKLQEAGFGDAYILRKSQE